MSVAPEAAWELWLCLADNIWQGVGEDKSSGNCQQKSASRILLKILLWIFIFFVIMYHSLGYYFKAIAGTTDKQVGY